MVLVMNSYISGRVQLHSWSYTLTHRCMLILYLN